MPHVALDGVRVEVRDRCRAEGVAEVMEPHPSQAPPAPARPVAAQVAVVVEVVADLGAEHEVAILGEVLALLERDRRSTTSGIIGTLGPLALRDLLALRL